MQETVEVPQLRCFDKVVDVPVVLVQLVETLQVQFLDAGHRQGGRRCCEYKASGLSCPF